MFGPNRRIVSRPNVGIPLYLCRKVSTFSAEISTNVSTVRSKLLPDLNQANVGYVVDV
jgi:hypothetical protein